MAARAAEPGLDAVLRFGDGAANHVLGRVAIGVGGGTGDVLLTIQATTEVLFGLADVLAKDMAAGALVLAEIAGGTAIEMAFVMRGGG